MKTLFSILILLFLNTGKAQPSEDDFDVMSSLKTQLHLIEKMLPFTLKHRKPTLYTIQLSIQNVISMNENYNPYHKKVRSAFRMYLVLANTPSYFEAISTKRTEKIISGFLYNVNKTAEILGTGESPLSTFTLETFTQVRELILKLDEHILFQDENLMNKDLAKRFLDLLATADGHDTKLMGQKGANMVHFIRAELYPMFDQDSVLASKEAFNLSIEIRALTEYYYAEYVDDE